MSHDGLANKKRENNTENDKPCLREDANPCPLKRDCKIIELASLRTTFVEPAQTEHQQAPCAGCTEKDVLAGEAEGARSSVPRRNSSVYRSPRRLHISDSSTMMPATAPLL